MNDSPLPFPMSSDAAVARLARFYEQLTPEDLPLLDRYYAPDARFKDPFNEVQGVAAIARVFERMFASLHEPRFRVTERVVQDGQAFLIWEFQFRFARWDTRTTQCIRGASHLRLDARGLVLQHRDYWDAAEELYEKLPTLGPLMRWLRRSLG
ncbi:MAG: nuclear transport factor 2 family protein [Pseudomonadota bacterium]|nr:nuclear transport factor 2 family protein [Pseudomonadota bacterium]